MTLSVVVCSYDILWEDFEGNFQKIDQILSTLTLSGVDLVVFPEFATSGFSLKQFSGNSWQLDSVVRWVAALSQKFGVALMMGSIVSEKGRFSNRCIVTDASGKMLVLYAKTYLYSLLGEEKIFEPGRGTTPFTLQDFRISPTICYDLRFPELLRSQEPMSDCFITIANWPSFREDHWKSLLKARAIENQAYVIGCNRSGHDPSFAYTGRSLIFDPFGRKIGREGTVLLQPMVQATLVLDEVGNLRQKFPALKDRKRSHS